VAIVTNIDADHLNTYGDLSGLEDAFADFCRLIGPDGFLVLCADDTATRRLADRMRAEGRRVETYGEAEDATLRLTALRSVGQSVRYLGFLDGRPLGEISLPVPGRHLGLNSAAAVLVAPGWACRPTRSSTRWPRSPGSGGGSSSRAWPTAYGSTTSTPTTPPR
jgi:UDP-N-acetylmuramate--alanine ligase